MCRCVSVIMCFREELHDEKSKFSIYMYIAVVLGLHLLSVVSWEISGNFLRIFPEISGQLTVTLRNYTFSGQTFYGKIKRNILKLGQISGKRLIGKLPATTDLPAPCAVDCIFARSQIASSVCTFNNHLVHMTHCCKHCWFQK